MSGRGGYSYGSGSMGYNDLEGGHHMADEAEKDARRQAIARLAGVVGILAFVGLGAFAAGKSQPGHSASGSAQVQSLESHPASVPSVPANSRAALLVAEAAKAHSGTASTTPQTTIVGSTSSASTDGTTTATDAASSANPFDPGFADVKRIENSVPATTTTMTSTASTSSARIGANPNGVVWGTPAQQPQQPQQPQTEPQQTQTQAQADPWATIPASPVTTTQFVSGSAPDVTTTTTTTPQLLDYATLKKETEENSEITALRQQLAAAEARVQQTTDSAHQQLLQAEIRASKAAEAAEKAANAATLAANAATQTAVTAATSSSAALAASSMPVETQMAASATAEANLWATTPASPTTTTVYMDSAPVQAPPAAVSAPAPAAPAPAPVSAPATATATATTTTTTTSSSTSPYTFSGSGIPAGVTVGSTSPPAASGASSSFSVPVPAVTTISAGTTTIEAAPPTSDAAPDTVKQVDGCALSNIDLQHNLDDKEGFAAVPMAQRPTYTAVVPEANTDKVTVTVIAEAMCTDCKEHSYHLDQHVMSQGADLRDQIEFKLEMMVIDGWSYRKGAGICEKGMWDCMLAQWHLSGQAATASSTLSSWDYTRCLFKAQDELIAHYYTSFPGHAMPDATSDLMEEVVAGCASSAGMSFDEIKIIQESKGVELLWDSFGRIKEYDDPVWIYVNDNYVEHEADWLATICASISGTDVPKACAAAMDLRDASATSMASSSADSVAYEAVTKYMAGGDPEKVSVYIVGEAFCPNCKEHSYYFDKQVMTPNGVRSGVRDIMNVYMEQMVLDGWSSDRDAGMCEKGKYDCVLGKYNLCAQKHSGDDATAWWDFSRCNYKHQAQLVAYYTTSSESYTGHSFMESVTKTCASSAGLAWQAVEECVAGEEGTTLLKHSYTRVSDMSMPVWIYVEGQKIAYHDDWLSAICSAYKTKTRGSTTAQMPEECTYA